MVCGQNLVTTCCGWIDQCWPHSCDNCDNRIFTILTHHAWRNSNILVWVSKSVKAGRLHFRVKRWETGWESWKLRRRLHSPQCADHATVFVRNLPSSCYRESLRWYWHAVCTFLLNEQDGQKIHSLWNLLVIFPDKCLVFKTNKKDSWRFEPYIMSQLSHHLVKLICFQMLDI